MEEGSDTEVDFDSQPATVAVVQVGRGAGGIGGRRPPPQLPIKHQLAARNAPRNADLSPGELLEWPRVFCDPPRPPLQSNLYRMEVHRFFLTPFSL